MSGLASNKEEHGRKDTQSRTLEHGIRTRLQDPRHLGAARRYQPQGLERLDHIRRRRTPRGRCAEHGQVVPEGVRLTHRSLERVVPLDLVIGRTHVLGMFNGEAHVLERLQTVLDGHHLGNAVADLETPNDPQMLWVGGVVLVGHDPLIAAKDAAGFEDPVSLAIDTLETRGVDGGLDRVAGVESGLVKGHGHEVALDKVGLGVQPGGDGVALGAADLVVVVIEACDMGAREVANLAGGAADAAANVEDAVGGLDVQVGSEIVLVAGDGLLEGLPGSESAEMEGGSPGILDNHAKGREEQERREARVSLFCQVKTQLNDRKDERTKVKRSAFLLVCDRLFVSVMSARQ